METVRKPEDYQSRLLCYLEDLDRYETELLERKNQAGEMVDIAQQELRDLLERYERMKFPAKNCEEKLGLEENIKRLSDTHKKHCDNLFIFSNARYFLYKQFPELKAKSNLK